MIKKDFLNEFIQQASQLMPGNQSRDELQKSLQVLAQSTLAKLDLVTRDEFDAQREVLARTRAKLDALEKELETLSERLENGA